MQNSTFKRNLEWEERVFSMISMVDNKSGTTLMAKCASSRTITSSEHVEHKSSNSRKTTPTPSASCSQNGTSNFSVNASTDGDDLRALSSERQMSPTTITSMLPRTEIVAMVDDDSSVRSVDTSEQDHAEDFNVDKTTICESSSSSPRRGGRQNRNKTVVTTSSKAEGVSRSVTNDGKRVVVVVKNLTIVKHFNKNGIDYQLSEHGHSEYHHRGKRAYCSDKKKSKKHQAPCFQHISRKKASSSDMIAPSRRSTSQAFVRQPKTTFQKELRTLDGLIAEFAMKLGNGCINRESGCDALIRAQIALNEVLHPSSVNPCKAIVPSTTHPTNHPSQAITNSCCKERGENFLEKDYGHFWF